MGEDHRVAAGRFQHADQALAPGADQRRLGAETLAGDLLQPWPACLDALLGDLRRRRDLAERGAHLGLDAPAVGQRSEEHTSELQSLMRSSSAVLCLKKKKDI